MLPLLFRPKKKLYLLQDEFTDTRAAGSVNTTPATPGPGTRTVTDTENRLSIGSGVLASTSKAVSAWGDPTIHYASLTRALGLILLSSYRNAAPGNYQIGFDADTAGFITLNYFIMGGGILSAAASGTESANVCSVPVNTTYKLALVVRATGAYYFIKSDVFTNWTLLWVSSMNALTPMYPSMNDYFSDIALDYIRIPKVTWLPTPLVYDTFTRANAAALGSTETLGPDGSTLPAQPVISRPWVNDIGSWEIDTNAAVVTMLPATHCNCDH